MKKNDVVNHPSHYTDGNIEVIDFIEDKGLGFCLGNAVKYISRAGKKYPDKEIEDLEKAIWYIKRRIKELKNGKPEKINECPVIGESKKIADQIDAANYVIKNVRPLDIQTIIVNNDAMSEYCEDDLFTGDTCKEDSNKEIEEDEIWNVVFKTLHKIDPNYTREEFEKDLEKAKEITEKEMPTLMDFSKLFK